MNCPECGIERTECVKTATMGSVTLRWRRCLCGVEFRTKETFVPKSVRLPAVTGNRGQPPTTAGNPPQLGGGVGGGLSSGQVSGPDPIPLSVPSQQSGARARVKEPPKYTPEFLAFWAAYPKKKHKGTAWAAWIKNAPPAPDVMRALAWQRETFDWRKESGQFVPLPASYLNARGWEDEPPARRATPASLPVREAPGASALRQWATDLRPAREPVSETDALEPPDWMGMAERAKGTG